MPNESTTSTLTGSRPAGGGSRVAPRGDDADAARWIGGRASQAREASQASSPRIGVHVFEDRGRGVF